MEIQVRLAELRDVSAIVNILRSIPGIQHLEAESDPEMRVHIDRRLVACLDSDDHTVFVAQTENGDVVGYGGVHWMPTLFLPGPEGYLSELFVLDSARGQGIGSALVAAMESEGQERGCCRLLVLNNRKRRSYKRRFYQKCGWEERKDLSNLVLNLEA